VRSADVLGGYGNACTCIMLMHDAKMAKTVVAIVVSL